jgi:hypothetical protein
MGTNPRNFTKIYPILIGYLDLYFMDQMIVLWGECVL